MHKKFEVNQTKIKGGCQSCRKAATHDSWSDLTLGNDLFFQKKSDIFEKSLFNLKSNSTFFLKVKTAPFVISSKYLIESLASVSCQKLRALLIRICRLLVVTAGKAE